MMNGARRRLRSDRIATLIVKMNPNAYGGTVSSWALAAE
jgi:hypothetical protein